MILACCDAHSEGQPGDFMESGAQIAECLSWFFLFDALNRVLERLNKRLRVSQVAFSQLEFRDQYTVFVHEDQAIALFHRNAL
jgi:hypothetical protein